MKSKIFHPIFLLLFILSHTTLCYNIDWSEPNSLDKPASILFIDISLSSVDGEEKKIEENVNTEEFGAQNVGTVVEAVKSNETPMQIPMKGWIIMTNDSFMAAYILVAVIVFLLASSAILLKRLKNKTKAKVFELNQFAPMTKAYGTEQFEEDTVYKPTTV